MRSAQKRHENFEIDAQSRQQAIRQERHEAASNACLIQLDGQSFEVINYSYFGIAIQSREPISDPATPRKAKMTVEGVTAAELELKHVRQEKLPNGAYKVAFEIISESLSIERIDAILAASQLIEEERTRLTEATGIPQNFRQLVYEVKDNLEQLQNKVHEMRNGYQFTSSVQIEIFESTVVEVISNYLSDIFNPIYRELSLALKGVPDASIKASFEFFRNQLKTILYQSPFAERSFTKPLGYAGDYEMMNLIYRNENLGDNLFAKCLHRYYLEHPETKAVRNRSEYLFGQLCNIIKNKKAGTSIKILSVACGPARELQMLLECKEKLDLNGIQFHLLDQDIISLRHAQQRIKELVRTSGHNIDARFINKAVKNVVARGLDDDNYDLIYSAGLFDYFSDPVALVGAQKLFGALKPGGRLIIGNFNLTSPNKFLMEIALDWHLLYRSQEDLCKLYSPLEGNVAVDIEPEGVNLFCVIKK